MKYKVTITDEKGSSIQPKFKTGSAAEHFAACVALCIDLVNGGSTRAAIENLHEQNGSATRNIITGLLPGGQTNPTLLKMFSETFSDLPILEGVFITFLGELHKHPQLQPDTFLNKWGNKNIGELNQLMQMSVTDTTKVIPLFFQFLNKVKIPGLGACKVTDLSNTVEKKAEQKSDTQDWVTITYPESSDDYVQRLAVVLPREVERKSNTHVSLSKFWFKQLPDRAVDELITELQVKDSRDNFKSKFKS